MIRRSGHRSAPSGRTGVSIFSAIIPGSSEDNRSPKISQVRESFFRTPGASQSSQIQSDQGRLRDEK